MYNIVEIPQKGEVKMTESFVRLIENDAGAIIVTLGCVIFACLWANEQGHLKKSSRRKLVYTAALAYTVAQAVAVVAYHQSHRGFLLAEILVSFILGFWAYVFKRRNGAIWVCIVAFYAALITMVL